MRAWTSSLCPSQEPARPALRRTPRRRPGGSRGGRGRRRGSRRAPGRRPRTGAGTPAGSVGSMQWRARSPSGRRASWIRPRGRPPRAGRGVVRHQLVHEVPRRLEGEGQRAQLVGSTPARAQQEDRPLERGVGEEVVEDAGPTPVEGDGGAHLVEDLDAGRKRGLHRVLEQQSLGEGVERADGGAVELAERAPGTARPRSGSRRRAAAAASSSRRTRSRSSAPAFSVKVMAATCAAPPRRR